MMGAGVGVLVAPYMPGGEPAIWPLIFMAAALGGMMRAPIMAAVFAARLAITGLDRVPVVEDENTYRLLGIVSRHDLVKPSMSVFNEEHELEQLRRVWIPRSVRLIPTNKREDVRGKYADVGR